MSAPIDSYAFLRRFALVIVAAVSALTSACSTSEIDDDVDSGPAPDDDSADHDASLLPVGLPHLPGGGDECATLPHREVEEACDVPQDPTADDDACTTHESCGTQNGMRGYCLQANDGGCYCRYDDCVTDADCETGYLCLCPPPEDISFQRVCVRAYCQADSDCATGFCLLHRFEKNCSWQELYEYRCATPDDECRSDETCENNAVDRRYCTAGPNHDPTTTDDSSVPFRCGWSPDEGACGD